ncbi:hypothetical protein FNV43_RR24736 [Rhamnella rubrinervis]|uniref:Exostosin GT47 domain-containing protein n=1 Tax=Rhamnella rubrinervis TaxID=2594499 RepID=A0A8K0GQZ7_9ROSA|nr:hypothetical protein FNV43_RR24736 [Rhamnella rubrinervis]
MSITSFLLFTLFVSLTLHSKPLHSLVSSPYLSPTIIYPDYQNMLSKFKVFVYEPNKPFTFNSPAESLFYTSLRTSPFVTQKADEAHLFFVPFPSDLSTRSIARLVRGLRTELPYWNRTLGADHFYVSCAGIGYESDRNLVELKKNSVQISCFAATAGKFIPHKDISLPPVVFSDAPHAPSNKTTTFLGYFRHSGVKESTLAKELIGDPHFVIETEPSDHMTFVERLSRSKFCLFDYGIDVSWIGEALRFGCVPAVIADLPIHDLPFMDVLRWQEIAVFVGSGGGAGEAKRVMGGVSRDRYKRMRELGVTSSQHFVWNPSPQPFDCFNTLMYQLWLRRHTIRYVRRE